MTDAFDRLKTALADRYAIQEEVGAGGMATVYLAEDLKHHRQVAVKVLRPELAATLGPERFLREIETAARLTHPHILPLYDSGEAGGFLYYVMPYIDGESLRERLVQHGELPIADAVKILREVVDALAHAHEQGVVHRDIKPDNVMLSGRHALVTDFGVAKAVSEATGRAKLTTAGVALGTPAYMAPEQATADPTMDHRADIYAVGAVGYEMLTGRPPFTGTTQQEVLSAHVTRTPDPVTKHRETVPPALAQLVMKCLEKKPADRWQSAEELLPQLEALATPSGGVTPTDTRPVTGLTSLRRRPTPAILITGILVVAAAITVLLLRGRTRASELDPDLLAVAPFDVIGSGLEMWGEGLSDMLSHSLDGAGPLRTVSPSLVVRRWDGRADPTSSAQLGASVGAGLAVYGRLVAAGGDSVRLAATLLDVASENVIGDAEVRSHRDHVDRLADSLAVRLLGQLSGIRELGAVQLHSLGSSSPAALKAFLQGEQHYRRFALDSAVIYYGRAIELDTTFALAYNRLGQTAGWGIQVGPVNALLLQAGALNRGLAVRESLLVAADSILAVVLAPATTPDSTTWALLRRLSATLERADRSYPNDPEIQYKIGEARLHFPLFGRRPEPALESFARAIELDSGFAPAYVHLIELQIGLQDIEGARQSIAAFSALGPRGADAEASRITEALLSGGPARSPEVELLLDTASVQALGGAWSDVRTLPDSAETAIRVGRAHYEKASPSSGSAFARRSLASSMAFRGHLQEARAITSERGDGLFWDRYVFTELALLGAVPPERAAEVFETWLESELLNRQHQFPMPWWASVGDTAAIQRARAVSESQIRSDTVSSTGIGWANWAIRKANFYLALARRDTVEALQLAERFPEYTCQSGCYYQRLTKAQLLTAAGRDREAAQLLDEGSNNVDLFRVPGDVTWQLERARVHDRLGNTDKAIRDYAFVVDVWRHADDLLQPFVTEAREALRRLTGELQQ